MQGIFMAVIEKKQALTPDPALFASGTRVVYIALWAPFGV